jgi:hypothetical protein
LKKGVPSYNQTWLAGESSAMFDYQRKKPLNENEESSINPSLNGISH